MIIDKAFENGVLSVRIDGRLDTNTSPELETALAELPEGMSSLVIDARRLEYISSAGLRVLLSAKKRCGRLPMSVVNASADVMGVFDVTGFSDLMEVSGAKREISVDGCERIGAGACGECFRMDDETIVKLYYPKVSEREIDEEKALAKKAFVLGVPTAISYDIVKCGSRTGVVYELVNAKTLTSLFRSDPGNVQKYTDLYADLCLQVHSTKCPDGSLPSFKDINRADVPNAAGLTDEERALMYEFIDIVPDADTCLHGDLNPNNIMYQNGECCLIDMGEFSTGMPMFDISRIMFSMVYAIDEDSDHNDFYDMPNATCAEIWRLFIKRYFGCDTLEEAREKNERVRWLVPLAEFRCVMSMLKGDRWPQKKRDLAMRLLREELIPFIKKERGR